MDRKRRKSIKDELVKKSQEAALTAIQIYNNPTFLFKSESFCVLMIISWTYLLHAFYKKNNVDYRYYDLSKNKKRKIYNKTKYGAFKRWELERCLDDKLSPIDIDTKNNLKFLIGLRHEIEHQMTNKIDDLLSARFQACILNYNYYLKTLFGDKYSLEQFMTVSLQLSSIQQNQIDLLRDYEDLPQNIESYIINFDNLLSDEEYNNPHFAYRVFYTPKLVNHKNQADKVIEFIRPDSDLAQNLKKQYVVLKESEKKKYLPKQIVDFVQKDYPNFNMRDFVQLWKDKDAKNTKFHYGAMVSNKTWYWYQSWIDVVFEYCEENKNLFK